jgi:hypothetical protein
VDCLAAGNWIETHETTTAIVAIRPSNTTVDQPEVFMSFRAASLCAALIAGPIVAAAAQGAIPVPAKPALMSRTDEMRMALAAAPAHLRDSAAVYVLEANGFVLARAGTNGFSCIVNRDHPLNRKPTCYDAEGTATILPKVIRVGELLMQGKPMPEINAEIQEGFRAGQFISPRRAGVAYMLSGDVQVYNPGSGTLGSFPPHIMIYAPNITSKDIGTTGPALAADPHLPFVAYQGPHGYIIIMQPDSAMSASMKRRP